MHEDSLGKKFKKIISFICFLLGVFTVLSGLFLLINYMVFNHNFIYEGIELFLAGIILAYLADQSIINSHRYEMTKYLVEENKKLIKKNRPNQGFQPLQAVIMPHAHERDIQLEFFQEHGDQNEFSKEQLENIMKTTNLSEEDAEIALKSKLKNVEEIEQVKQKAIDDDRFELVRFLEKLIDIKSNNS